MTNLVALLESAGLKRGIRALQLGRASPNTQRQLDPLLGAYSSDVTRIELQVPDGQAAAGVQHGDPFNMQLPDGIGLCVVTLALSRQPDVFEELISDHVAPIMQPGGVVIVQFCRDASEAALGALKASNESRTALQSFMRDQFGSATLRDPSPLLNRFSRDAVYEFVGWAPRTGQPNEPLVWLALRRRAPGQGTRAFPRTDRANRYPLRQLRSLVEELKNANVEFLPVDAFADRIARAPGSSFAHLKLDLHRQIHRPLEVGRVLSEEGVRALVLMMPRHPFNEAFFDQPHTWDILRAMRDGGHEVGLHLDVFHLIRAFGDLYKGMEAAVNDFRKQGFEVRAATLHGDTRKHVVERGMVREDFFEEDAPRSVWDGKPPEGEAMLADHVRRYSYRALAEKFGITYLAEEWFRTNGVLADGVPMTYLTDNNRALEVRNLRDAPARIVAPDQFRIEPEFARTLADRLRGQPFLALFHPQWFW
jgi:hypothetical protein